MINPENKKRIFIFIAIAFGISWATALAILFTGGITNSPMIVPELNMTLSTVLMATLYMWAPAIANLLTRAFTREGWKNLWLAFKGNKFTRYILIAWFLPGILVIGGAAIFFWLLPQFYDANLETFTQQLAATAQNFGTEAPVISPWTLMLLQAAQAFLLAPILNALFTFGEEFGWRAYLLPKLMPLGGKKAVLISGVVWGVWHWPLILMGYNYGFNYPGAPWLGPLAMVWFTLTLGVIISWLTLRSGSVWPAVIAHGAINGIAAIGIIASNGYANPLLGPTPVGIIGGILLTAMAALIFFIPGSLKMPEAELIK